MHVFVYLGSIIRVDRERSGLEVARVLDPRQGLRFQPYAPASLHCVLEQETLILA